MKVNQSDMEAALQFLADTDVDFARSQALYQGLDEQTKTVRAQLGFMSSEKSASSKEMFALQHSEYKKHLQKVQDANVTYLTLRAQRATSAQVIDCWRSLNSARNKGQVI